MLRTLTLASILMLPACGFTSQGDAARMAVQEYGARAMDEGLANGEWFMCQGASVGSVRRRYGVSAEMAQAYKTICPDSSAFGIILDAEPISE